MLPTVLEEERKARARTARQEEEDACHLLLSSAVSVAQVSAVKIAHTYGCFMRVVSPVIAFQLRVRFIRIWAFDASAALELAGGFCQASHPCPARIASSYAFFCSPFTPPLAPLLPSFVSQIQNAIQDLHTELETSYTPRLSISIPAPQ